VRWIPLLLAFLGTSCMTLTREGSGVVVYQAPQKQPPARRAMPTGCALVKSLPATAMTEQEMLGQDDPYRRQRNDAAAAGANALLVLTEQTTPRRDFECPAASPITDCPPSSGAWFQVVFEMYTCTPDALAALKTTPAKE
jgi:hypothetical protein